MITPAQIERIAKVLAGDAPGWQTRFAGMLGTSRGYVSNLVSGERAITQKTVIRIAATMQREIAAMEDRLDSARAALAELPTLGEVRELPRGDDNDEA